MCGYWRDYHQVIALGYASDYFSDTLIPVSPSITVAFYFRAQYTSIDETFEIIMQTLDTQRGVVQGLTIRGRRPLHF